MIINYFSDLPNLSSLKKISLDIETHDPNLKKLGPGAIRNDGRIVGIGIVSTEDFQGWYLPESLLLEKEKIIDWFKQYNFELIMGQNILYDIEWLACYGIKFEPKYFLDSMFAEAIINEGAKKDLNTLGLKYVGQPKNVNEIRNYIVKVLGKPDKDWQNHISLAPKEIIAPYCLDDASLVIKILRQQKKVLQRSDLFSVFLKECSLIPILLEMKLKGIKVNQHKIKLYYKLLNREIHDLKEELNNVNVESPLQVAEFLKKKDSF